MTLDYLAAGRAENSPKSSSRHGQILASLRKAFLSWSLTDLNQNLKEMHCNANLVLLPARKSFKSPWFFEVSFKKSNFNNLHSIFFICFGRMKKPSQLCQYLSPYIYQSQF